MPSHYIICNALFLSLFFFFNMNLLPHAHIAARRKSTGLDVHIYEYVVICIYVTNIF